MSRSFIINKETANTFYHTNYTDHIPYPFKTKLANTNTEAVQQLNIEAQSKIEKLKDKISLDQAKIQRNYAELEELSLQIEKSCQRISQDKEIQTLIKSQKESIKDIFANCKGKTNLINVKYLQQTSNIRQALQLKGRELQRQKQERQNDVLKMIDQFQVEIVQVEKQLKQIRMAEEEVFQKLEVDIYNLEQHCNIKLENESNTRKKEHQTIIKLIGDCIQNFRYIY